MKTTLGKKLMTTMAAGVFAGIIAFSVCHRTDDMTSHGMEPVEIKSDASMAPLLSIQNEPRVPRQQGFLIAYDGGGAYGG